MRRWVRRLCFVLGLLILFAGGVGSSTPIVVVGALLVGASLLPSRSDTPSGRTVTPRVVEARGQTWTQGSDNRWLRWNQATQTWDDAGLPPPEVLRASGAPEAPRRDTTLRTIAGTIAAALVAATLWAFFDPRAQVPLVSPVVCSLKGKTWHSGSTIVPAGCYERDI